MKKALLIAAAILLLAGSINAQGTAYMGVYGDLDHSVCTLSPGLYQPFHAYIMCLPSVRGMQAAEFTLVLPPTVISTGSAKNSDISVELGSLTGGISAAFLNCHYGWTMIYDVTLMALAMTPGYVGLSGDISVSPPIFAVASCEPGYPSEPVIYHASLALYQGCQVGVQSSTWGAIKNLF